MSNSAVEFPKVRYPSLPALPITMILRPVISKSFKRMPVISPRRAPESASKAMSALSLEELHADIKQRTLFASRV